MYRCCTALSSVTSHLVALLLFSYGKVLSGTISSRLHHPALFFIPSVFQLGLVTAFRASPPFGSSLALPITRLLLSFYSKLSQGRITRHLHLAVFRPAGALCVWCLVLHCHTVSQLSSYSLLYVFNQFSPKEREKKPRF